jgi:hypothetical protein
MALDPGLGIGVVILTNIIGIDPEDYARLAFSIINYVLEKPDDKAAENLTKYEGIYQNIWGESAIMGFGSRLISFDPGSFEPLAHAAILEPIEANDFLVTGSEEIQQAGELASFDMGKDGVANRVRWGATYADRFLV